MAERKVTISTVAPISPNVGDSWIHSATRVEKLWSGTAWEAVLANLTEAKIWVGDTSSKPKEENKPAGGADTKSGQSTGVKGAIVQVDFATAFSSIPRVTLATHSDIGAWLTEVATGHFKWTNNSKGPDVTIDWMATEAGNS